MRLSLEQIREMTTGAVCVREEESGVRFYRYTEAELEAHAARNCRDSMEIPHYMYYTSAGIRLRMRTDSKSLYLRAVCVGMNPAIQNYFSFDVYAGGNLVGTMACLDNTGIEDVHEKTFALGEGVKEVHIHLPHSVAMAVQELRLDEGAFAEAVRPEKQLLCYGDSITQGYSAYQPSRTYSARVADALQASCMNKAVGGDRVFEEIVQEEDDLAPDYITVAYGTNDTNYTAEDYASVYRKFIAKLSAKHPRARIFAISPIWRADWNEPLLVGTHEDMENVIRAQCEDLPNVTFLCGWDLVPHDPACMRDGRVHPNDEGFDAYADNLIAAIKKELE